MNSQIDEQICAAPNTIDLEPRIRLARPADDLSPNGRETSVAGSDHSWPRTAIAISSTESSALIPSPSIPTSGWPCPMRRALS